MATVRLGPREADEGLISCGVRTAENAVRREQPGIRVAVVIATDPAIKCLAVTSHELLDVEIVRRSQRATARPERLHRNGRGNRRRWRLRRIPPRRRYYGFRCF